jgi:excinuclease ABC subunit B
VLDIMGLEIPGSGLSIGNVKTKIAESVAEYKALSPKQAARKLKQLEEKMYQHAKDLEFEAAAAVRDEIKLLQAEMMI